MRFAAAPRCAAGPHSSVTSLARSSLPRRIGSPSTTSCKIVRKKRKKRNKPGFLAAFVEMWEKNELRPVTPERTLPGW